MFSAFQISAFQNSAFQIAKAVVSAVTGGGIPQKSQARRSRRVFVEYKDKIYVFDTGDHAQAWLESVKAQEPKKRTKRKPIDATIAPPLETVDLSVVKRIAQEFGKAKSINDLIRSKDYSSIVSFYEDAIARDFEAKRIQNEIEEEELTILLMAI